MNTETRTIGYKVVDRRRDEVESLLIRSMQEQRPFEIGLYFNDPATHDLIEQFLPDNNLLLNTHIDHRRLNVFALDNHDTVPQLKRQIELSLSWGADYGINHLSAFTLSRRPEYQASLHQRLIKQLRLLNSICREYRFPIYIENTYHELGFYQQIFESILEHRLDYLHFCFDFGHAKVWSSEPLTRWLAFLSDLKKRDKKIHFHLHTNRGLSDEHLSFLEAEWLGIIETDSYTNPYNTFEAVELIDREFPESRKLMEVPPQEAVENLRMISEEIDRIRRHSQLRRA